MQQIRSCVVQAAGAALAISFATTVAQAQVVQPLLPAGGSDTSYAQSINADGTVAGYSNDGVNDLPTVWRPTVGGYVAELLPLPDGDYTNGGANSIAGNGSIAGYVLPDDQNTASAVIWTETSPGGGYTATVLPTFVDAVFTGAYAVNSSNHVAGFAENGDGDSLGVVWTPDAGGYIGSALTAPPFSTAATSINEAGDVGSYAVAGPITSVVWTGGSYTPHTVIAADSALVTAINSTGTGTGVYAGNLPLVMAFFEGDYYAFSLPVPFDSDGASNGVNSFDYIVGTVKDLETPTSGFEAAMWVPTEFFWDYVNLDAWLDATDPTLGEQWTLLDAWSITDNWLVTGQGFYDPDGAGPLSAVDRAFVLDVSPLIPEPTALALLPLFSALLLRRRRSPALART